MRLLHAVAFLKQLPWFEPTNVISLKMQPYAVNACVKRSSQRSLRTSFLSFVVIIGLLMFSLLKLHCNECFMHAFTALHCIFRVEIAKHCCFQCIEKFLLKTQKTAENLMFTNVTVIKKLGQNETMFTLEVYGKTFSLSM